jgi:hypothetical protein
MFIFYCLIAILYTNTEYIFVGFNCPSFYQHYTVDVYGTAVFRALLCLWYYCVYGTAVFRALLCLCYCCVYGTVVFRVLLCLWYCCV